MLRKVLVFHLLVNTHPPALWALLRVQSGFGRYKTGAKTALVRILIVMRAKMADSLPIVRGLVAGQNSVSAQFPENGKPDRLQKLDGIRNHHLFSSSKFSVPPALRSAPHPNAPRPHSRFRWLRIRSAGGRVCGLSSIPRASP